MEPNVKYMDEGKQKEIRDLLKTDDLLVTFIKADGDQRHLLCTLREAVLPVPDEGKAKPARTPSPEALAVWDLEKEAWRSFRWDSIVKVVLLKEV